MKNLTLTPGRYPKKQTKTGVKTVVILKSGNYHLFIKNYLTFFKSGDSQFSRHFFRHSGTSRCSDNPKNGVIISKSSSDGIVPGCSSVPSNGNKLGILKYLVNCTNWTISRCAREPST